MARRSAHQLFRAPGLLFPRVRLLQRVVLLVLCLSVLQRSLNNYDGEFASTLDQADRHLDDALELVNRSITEQ